MFYILFFSHHSPPPPNNFEDFSNFTVYLEQISKMQLPESPDALLGISGWPAKQETALNRYSNRVRGWKKSNPCTWYSAKRRWGTAACQLWLPDQALGLIYVDIRLPPPPINTIGNQQWCWWSSTSNFKSSHKKFTWS